MSQSCPLQSEHARWPGVPGSPNPASDGLSSRERLLAENEPVITEPNPLRTFTSPSEERNVNEFKPARSSETPSFEFDPPPRQVSQIRLEPEEKNRTVRRRLRGVHIFMITINGILGAGLYFRGGLILRLGGPLAVLSSFTLIGILAWAVMQCITEMLCIWPITGALPVYVSEFVDVELGIAVGIAYWYTYSISFAALISAIAGEAKFWGTPVGVQGAVLFFLMPIILMGLNAFRVEIYGLIEIIGGSIKLLFLFVILIIIMTVKPKADSQVKLGNPSWSQSFTAYDSDAAHTWGTAFLMSLSIASFAYIGVEIVAATALEARVPTQSTEEKALAADRKGILGTTAKFSAKYISVLAMVTYVTAGLIISLKIAPTSVCLPQVSWVHPARNKTLELQAGNSTSAFVCIAEASGIRGLASGVNLFIVVAALTCANTNLYVASRVLFSLARTLDESPGQPWYMQFIAWLGKTDRHRVPLRAMIFSCLCFAWVPFLNLSSKKAGAQITGMDRFIDTLSEMSSSGIIIVWACECGAFIRFYHCIDKNKDKDALKDVPHVRRWDYRPTYDDYPYRSHWQPYSAYIALASCLFLLVIANGAYLWNGIHLQPFASAYLGPICFLGMWALLKYIRKAPWQLVDLSDGDVVRAKMIRLHEIRFRSAEEEDNDFERSSWNLCGTFNFKY